MFLLFSVSLQFIGNLLSWKREYPKPCLSFYGRDLHFQHLGILLLLPLVSVLTVLLCHYSLVWVNKWLVCYLCVTFFFLRIFSLMSYTSKVSSNTSLFFPSDKLKICIQIFLTLSPSVSILCRDSGLTDSTLDSETQGQDEKTMNY